MNPYEELGLRDTNCSIEDINVIYKCLSKQYHPDMPDGDEKKFIRIKLAVDILRDPERRKLFDEHGIYDDKKNINTIAKERFTEMCNSWIDTQLKSRDDVNVTKYFNQVISSNDTRIKDTLSATEKTINKLNKALNRVKSKEEINIVSGVIQLRIDALTSSKKSLEEEKIILNIIRELSSKYSSKDEELGGMYSPFGGSFSSSYGRSDFVQFRRP